jgi:hypothetical protein
MQDTGGNDTFLFLTFELINRDAKQANSPTDVVSAKIGPKEHRRVPIENWS